MSAFWLMAILMVDPRGEFPIWDDWVYARAVREMLAGHGYAPIDWMQANLFSQVVWGAGFATVFGDSVTVLRLSTLVLGLLGGFALYALVRAAGGGRGVALLAALTLLFNPLYLMLSFTFMTDVPFLAMQTGAIALIAIGALQRSRLRSALGWLLGIAALLCRQIAACIPISFLAEALVRRPWSWRRVALASGSIVAFGVVQYLFTTWLSAIGRLPSFLNLQVRNMGDTLAGSLDHTAHVILFFVPYCFYCLGFFLLPLSLACVPFWRAMLAPKWSNLAYPAVIAFSLAAFMLAQASGDVGVGILISSIQLTAPLPYVLHNALVALASLGGTLMLAAISALLVSWLGRRVSDRFDVLVFVLAVAFVVLAPLALVPMRFLRYVLPAVPGLIVALAAFGRGPPSTTWSVASFASLMVMAVVSVAAAHDYMAEQRLKWSAYNTVTREVPTRFVDAGWEFNGNANWGRVGDPANALTWFQRADYVVGGIPREGYAVTAAYPVDRWLPRRVDTPVSIQRRVRPAQRHRSARTSPRG